MKLGIRYVVTEPSDDGTFECGDHVWLSADGSINCHEANGWIDADDVAEATKGMGITVDTEWLAKRKKQLSEELNKLNCGIGAPS